MILPFLSLDVIATILSLSSICRIYLCLSDSVIGLCFEGKTF